MRLKFLGTGAGFSVGLGNTSAIVYDKEPKNGFTMIDCGEHARSKLVELGIVDNLKNVLITHIHGDHYFGIELLAFYWFFVKKEKLNVYLPSTTIKDELIKSLSSSLCKVQNENGDPIEKTVEDFLNIQVIDSVTIDKTIYRFFKVPHVPNKECYGVQIMTESGVSIYTSDINRPIWDINDDQTSFIYRGLKNYNYIFHDAQLYDGKAGAVHAFIGDLKNDILSQKVSKENSNKLILMHYGKPQTDDEKAKAKEWCGGFAIPEQEFDI